MSQGYLAVMLHAHLPYVRHPEHEEFLEEDWLFEAITETYIPLLQTFHRLVDEGIDFKITMSVTPTLCSMLRDPLLQGRAVRYIDRAIALARKELERTRHEPRMNEIAQFYLERFVTCRALYVDAWKCDLIGQFRKLLEKGVLEIITSAATHGFLPLMEDFPESMRAQILIARDYHRECFGQDPTGIWLPECAYVPSVNKILQEANIRWFVLDSHGLMFGKPRPRYAIYSPVFTPTGVAAFARDRESSKQVWSAEEGYPGDPAYRDFYRDIGFDAPLEYLQPFLGSDKNRKFTGFKYYRITGRTENKDYYRREWALGAADAHATDFMQSRARQIGDLMTKTNIDPLVLSPFDAELFGHWWFEGPEFLNWFLRKSVYDQQTYKLTTPTHYLTDHSTLQVVVPCASSWGHMGYWEVWLNDTNAWIYPHLHAAAVRMTEVARENADLSESVLPDETKKVKRKKGTQTNYSAETMDRALKQLARELLLAQSSDWAFLMKTGTASAYATKRTRDHILRFTKLYDQIKKRQIDTKFLADLESRDNLFPNINWKYYV